MERQEQSWMPQHPVRSVVQAGRRRLKNAVSHHSIELFQGRHCWKTVVRDQLLRTQLSGFPCVIMPVREKERSSHRWGEQLTPQPRRAVTKGHKISTLEDLQQQERLQPIARPPG